MTDELQRLSDEQRADLAALTAAADDGAPPLLPGEEPQGEAGGMDAADQWAMLPAMVGSVLKMALPDLEKVYTPENCRNWGAAMVPVAEKYGWDVSGVMSVEVVAIAATVPFILGTAQAVQAAKVKAQAAISQARAGADPMALAKAERTKSAEELAGNSVSKAVQFGTVEHENC